MPLALLACGALALAGGLSHRHALSIAAALLLLLAWLPAILKRRSVGALLGWAALAALLLVPALLGHAQLALMALPVLFLAGVCWVFGSTLRRGREPLISRCVRVIEGQERLDLPGVRAYTRGVTLFWAWLLGAMALLSLTIALLAEPGGWLLTLGVHAPFGLPGSLLAWYPEVGCWAVLVAAFVGEYLFRRWHLRRLPHPPAHQFVIQMIKRWPALLRDKDGGA
ncbi:MAG TPA: xanthomonadin biosynthesis protein [Rhodanobacteraceae bacterium]|nr:xanthomonadin biosynthesis protein [Rhodanobacteraceae bacterium]